MQVTITQKSAGLCVVTTNEATPRTINFTPRKSGWYAFGIAQKQVGATFEIPDEQILTANTGRTVVDQMTSQVALEAWQMQSAFAKVNASETALKVQQAALAASEL